MEDHVRVRFTTPDIETERLFLEEYVLDAVERMEAVDACSKFIFIRAGHDPSLDEGAVIVDIYGDPDAIFERERETWNSLVEDGPLEEWTVDETDVPAALADYFGEQGTVLHEEMRFLATRLAPSLLRAFESTPAAVDTHPEEGGEPVGWHRLIHFLSNHSVREGGDAYLKNIESMVDSTAQMAGVDTAEEMVDEYLDRLETVRNDIKQYRD